MLNKIAIWLKMNINLFTALLLISSMALLSATKIDIDSYGDPAPIKVSLDYSSDQLGYQKGQIVTVNFRIYINKADLRYYKPGHKYLLKFDKILENIKLISNWTVLDTSIRKPYVIINDEHFYYQGHVTMKCNKNNSLFVFNVSAFRIAQQSRNEYNVEYKRISDTQYSGDQFRIIHFRNPRVESLNNLEKESIDFDSVIQKEISDRMQAINKRYRQ